MRNILFLLLLMPLSACGEGDQLSGNVAFEKCSDKNAGVEDVVQACSVIVETKTSSPESRGQAYFFRARAHLNSKNHQAVIADTSEVIKLQPGNSDSYGMRGISYGEIGQVDKAMADFRQTIKLNPQDDNAYSNLGLALEKTGDLRGSLAMVNRALQLNPQSLPANTGRCWVLAVLNEDLDGAIANCNKSIELDPADANLYNSRGLVNFRLGNYQAAIDDYDAAINSNPNVASSYYVRALAKKALHKNIDIRSDIEKAMRLEPKVAQRYAGFGVE